MLALILCSLSVVHSCSEYTDCGTCSTKSRWIGFIRFDCVWCPLDRECHTWGSQYTPCLGFMNVNDPDQCLATDDDTYNASDAYVNALLSSAAYSGSPQQCLDAIHPTGGFDVHEIIAVRCDSGLFDYDECTAFSAVSTSAETIVIAYQGSYSVEQVIDQFLTNLGSPENRFRTGGKVFQYFGDAFQNLYPCVQGSVQDLLNTYPTYKVVVTGYSLGAALASLTAAALVFDGLVSASRLELYTFGMPRVGEKEYAYNFDRLLRKGFHIVHHRDIVPHLPPCNILGCNIPYNGAFHSKREVYYRERSTTVKISSQFNVCHSNEDSSCSNGAITDDPCFDITECIAFHYDYFGLRIGEECGSALGPDATGNPWNSQLSYTCQRFND